MDIPITDKILIFNETRILDWIILHVAVKIF